MVETNLNLNWLSNTDKKAVKKGEVSLGELGEIYELILTNNTYKFMKTFEIGDDKEDNFDSFLASLTSGKMTSAVQIADYVHKAYIENGHMEDALKYVSIVDGKVEKPYHLVADYIERYLINENEKEEFKDEIDEKSSSFRADVYNYLGKIFARRMTERFSDYVYVDTTHLPVHSKVRTKIFEWLNANGLERLDVGENMPVIFVNGKPKISERQEFIKNAYVDIVNKYAENLMWKFHASALNTVSAKAVKKDWIAMREILNSLYGGMTEESKQDVKIISAKAKTEWLFDDKFFSKFLSVYTDEKRGDEFSAMSKAVSELKVGTRSNESKQTISNFMEKLEILNVALNEKTTKNGKSYAQPANYFKIMGMKPVNCFYFIVQLQKLFANNKELSEKLEEARANVRNNFGWSWNAAGAVYNNHDENMKDLTVDKVLSMASNLGVVNKSNKHGVIGSEELEQCAGKTIEYIEENKLPKYSTCVRAIYDALLKGQEPISEKYLSNKDDKKELERE